MTNDETIIGDQIRPLRALRGEQRGRPRGLRRQGRRLQHPQRTGARPRLQELGLTTEGANVELCKLHRDSGNDWFV